MDVNRGVYKSMKKCTERQGTLVVGDYGNILVL